MLVTLVLSFAVLVTSHVALVYGLTMQRPRWRGPVALLVPPLAPFWGVTARMYLRSAFWLMSLLVYAAIRFLAAV